MHVFRFQLFGWETPIRAPKIGVFDPLNGEAYQRNHEKAHPLPERRHMTYRSSKSVHQCDLCTWRSDQKEKERQRKTSNSVKMGIEMKFCTVGGLQMVVLGFKFHQNWLSGFGAVGRRICPSPLTWPLAYTTACTIEQANAGQCPTWWPPSQIYVAPSIQCRKVWLTPTTRMSCSNAAKMRNSLKFAGVPQSRQQISAVSRPKFTISWGHVEEVSCLTSFFRLSIHALAAKIQPNKVVRWCQNGDFCVLYLQRAACSTFQTCILNSH